jgi:hypothetical protein
MGSASVHNLCLVCNGTISTTVLDLDIVAIVEDSLVVEVESSAKQNLSSTMEFAQTESIAHRRTAVRVAAFTMRKQQCVLDLLKNHMDDLITVSLQTRLTNLFVVHVEKALRSVNTITVD